MPHVNDKRVLRTMVRELGIPSGLLRGQAGNDRLRLDFQSPGQQEFNGLLFRCLGTPRELNPWDWSTGRSFIDLQCYTSWGAAVSDGFVLSVNAPARVAAYLLPFSRDAVEPSDRIAGIPGLRLLSAEDGTIFMQHIPTGGKLAITDSTHPAVGSLIARSLEMELESVRSTGTDSRLFRAASMSEGELSACTAFHRHSHILSGLDRKSVV